MAKSKKKRPTRPASTRITSTTLRAGWPAPHGYRIRLARPGDLDAAADLLEPTGAVFDDDIKQAVRAGATGVGLGIGLDRGKEALLYELACSASAGALEQFFLSMTGLFVAHDPGGRVVGALLAMPPAGVLAQAVQGGLDKMRALMVTVAAVKIKAVAVAEPARGHDLGGALLRRTAETYRQVGYHLMYGQLHTGAGLEAYYQHQGFDVLGPGQGLSFEPLLDLPLAVHTDPTERIFVRNLRHRPRVAGAHGG